MKWNKFKAQQEERAVRYLNNVDSFRVDIECPRCGSRLFRQANRIAASYPPQHYYFCKTCSWRGTA